MAGGDNDGRIRRLVFKEINAGDLLKFKAEAAPSGTGGGARDLRFRPFGSFDGVFGRILTGREMLSRRRGNAVQMVEIYTSTVVVVGNNGSRDTRQLTFEPPTDARPNEGRLARVHKLKLTVPSDEGRVLFLLFQTAEPTPFIAFATEKQISDNAWHADLNQFFAEALAKSAPRHVARGFIDFDQPGRFIG